MAPRKSGDGLEQTSTITHGDWLIYEIVSESSSSRHPVASRSVLCVVREIYLQVNLKTCYLTLKSIMQAKKNRVLKEIEKNTWLSAQDIINKLRWSREDTNQVLTALTLEEKIAAVTNEETGENYFGLIEQVASLLSNIPKKETNKMSNRVQSTNDIRQFLIAQMEAVANGTQSPEQAKAICTYAQQLYNVTKLEIDFMKITDKVLSAPKVPAIEFKDEP